MRMSSESRPAAFCVFSLEVDQFHVKDERGVAGDRAGDAALAVAHVGRDGQLGVLALGHLQTDSEHRADDDSRGRCPPPIP